MDNCFPEIAIFGNVGPKRYSASLSGKIGIVKPALLSGNDREAVLPSLLFDYAKGIK